MRPDPPQPDQLPYEGPTIPMRRPDHAADPPPTLRPMRRRRRNRPHRDLFTILRLVVLGLLALLVVGLLLGYLQVRDLASQTVVHDPRPGIRSISPAAPFTMLLIGVDEREGFPEEGVRGDTLIVARVDPVAGWVALLSIPRDTLVNVRNLGESKLNAAYGYGYGAPAELYDASVEPRASGMALAAETVEQFLGIPIDYTAQVNFAGFAGIVDALGGIMIDVPRPIVDDEYPTEDFGVTRIEFAAGPQRMDGAHALIYARTRHADSDFGRAERQQQVIRAISDELRARGPLGLAFLLPSLRTALGETVATTLPFDRIDAVLGLGTLATRLDSDRLLRLQLSPETVALREEGTFLVWDQAGVDTMVDQLWRGPSVAAEAAMVQVLNGTDAPGLAGDVTNRLVNQGFSMLPAADAMQPAGARTVVYDRTGKPLTAQRLAQSLRADLRRGAPQGETSAADIVVVLGDDAR